MKKIFYLFVLVLALSCKSKQSALGEHIGIVIHTYEMEGVLKAAAMPEFKGDSSLMKYKRRFEYLYINLPKIHDMDQFEARNAIFNLYPDSNAMKVSYLDKLKNDKKLKSYFEATLAPFKNPNMKRKSYSVNELMEVASKFFYCDRIEPDTTVIAHVCVGLNGVKEAQWKKDYTLLEAFCFEAIFNDIDKDDSKIWTSFVSKKRAACNLHKVNITSLENYLQSVKLDVFQQMKEDEGLKVRLLAYFNLNKTNLAFEIVKGKKS